METEAFSHYLEVIVHLTRKQKVKRALFTDVLTVSFEIMIPVITKTDFQLIRRPTSGVVHVYCSDYNGTQSK